MGDMDGVTDFSLAKSSYSYLEVNQMMKECFVSSPPTLLSVHVFEINNNQPKDQKINK